MRIFGCVAYALVPSARRTKLDAKGIKCLFLGYCEGTKAYRLMCVESKAIIKSQDVTFLEDGGADPKLLEMSPSGSSGGPAHKVGTTPRVHIEDEGDEVEEDEELVEPKKKVATPQVKR
jgi:hypothetical protein